MHIYLDGGDGLRKRIVHLPRLDGTRTDDTRTGTDDTRTGTVGTRVETSCRAANLRLLRHDIDGVRFEILAVDDLAVERTIDLGESNPTMPSVLTSHIVVDATLQQPAAYDLATGEVNEFDLDGRRLDLVAHTPIDSPWRLLVRGGEGVGRVVAYNIETESVLDLSETYEVVEPIGLARNAAPVPGQLAIGIVKAQGYGSILLDIDGQTLTHTFTKYFVSDRRGDAVLASNSGYDGSNSTATLLARGSRSTAATLLALRATRQRSSSLIRQSSSTTSTRAGDAEITKLPTSIT